MAELPYMQLYVADYLRDTEILSLTAQGAWARMLCSMWHPDRRGVLCYRLSAVARLLGANEQAAKGIIEEIKDCRVGDVEWEGDRVTITSRRMVRDWAKMEAEKQAAVAAGQKGAAKRWGNKNGESNRVTNSPPIPPPIAAPNTKSEGIIQKSEEREPPRPAPAAKPTLSPSQLMPIDRVKIELATVWPDAPKHMTGQESHDLFSSLAVLDELTPEDWLACRAWILCPDRIRGRKLWPRNRAEFVANAGEAIEAIRTWWRTGGGRQWWNRHQSSRPTAPVVVPDPVPSADVIEDPDEALKFFRECNPRLDPPPAEPKQDVA
ncbi:hypothetical protein OKA05_09075 [Luteolibacter arcticus]|uniref:DUF1376 domain-containing protein n=1 Tax=Luteolibacter arcticus TaxID=1581411 RepID=A0ABT3GHN5_9BACT|nr:hypothetical protein [Luteolibacter arcticus]MCW1922704.1 hypothetical protein [Luteolibacter arcticus]